MRVRERAETFLKLIICRSVDSLNEQLDCSAQSHSLLKRKIKHLNSILCSNKVSFLFPRVESVVHYVGGI